VLRWIQETDSSRLLFDEVAQDFLRIVFYSPFTVCAPIEDTSVANRFDLPANRGNMAGTRRNCPDCIGNGNVANAATGSMFNIAAFNPIPEGPVGNCGVGILEGPAHSESPEIRPKSMPSGDHLLQADIVTKSGDSNPRWHLNAFLCVADSPIPDT
jgi:hypothetical protein